MIIWGSKGKQKIVGRGHFYCPKCNSTRPYEHIRIGKYFTLYFIPIFQTQNLGEYIECKTCFTPYKTSILEYKTGFNHKLQGTCNSSTKTDKFWNSNKCYIY